MEAPGHSPALGRQTPALVPGGLDSLRREGLVRARLL